MCVENLKTDIFTLIVGIIIAVIGLIILFNGIRRKGRILQAIGAAFIFSALISFLSVPETRELLLAGAAIAAIFLSMVSIYDSRRLRADGIEKDERNRKQSELNEITEWAINILSTGSDLKIDFLSYIQMPATMWAEASEMQVRSDLKTLWIRYRTVMARIERIKTLAENFNDDKLLILVNDVQEKLQSNLTTLNDRSEGTTDDVALGQAGKALEESVNLLIRTASNVKV